MLKAKKPLKREREREIEKTTSQNKVMVLKSDGIHERIEIYPEQRVFFLFQPTEKRQKKVNDFRRTHAKNRPSFGLTSCNKARVFFHLHPSNKRDRRIIVQINLNMLSFRLGIYVSVSLIKLYEQHIKSRNWSYKCSGVINAYASENEFSKATARFDHVAGCTENRRIRWKAIIMRKSPQSWFSH